MPPLESSRLLAQQALRLPLSQREDHLRDRAPNPAALAAARAELARLVDASESARPTETPAGDTISPALDADEILSSLIGTPGTIGPYRIERQLGAGGMGEVFLAEQTEPVRRQVAVKVIRMGMSTRSVLARFELERQALARMNHPHIARVFDAGTTTSGQPYFAMEFIDGVPLTTYCERHSLPLAARIRLFQQICDGVEHAHRKGVLHRDLKPGNILVSQDGDRPRVKIIDFGLARAVDPAQREHGTLTAAGDLLGTPDYMAPEQASLDSDREVDTRTDVYALGVVLYELLTGLLPHADPTRSRTDVLEVLRRIRETQPLRPSARVRESEATTIDGPPRRRGSRPDRLARRLRGDLDWIVMRAMAKEPERRYPSPGALAEDLERHVNLLPVQAGPDRLSYRAGRLARKYRGPLTAAALLILAISIGGGIATHLAIRNAALAADKTRLADRNLRLARSESREKQNAEALARDKTALAAEAEAASQFQSRQLADLDPYAFGLEIRTGILREARAEYERQRYDDVDARVDRLRAQLDGLSLSSLAAGTLERGLLAPGLETIDRDYQDRPLLQARLLQAAGQTLTAIGLGTSAVEALERAVTIRTEKLGKDHELTLDTLHYLGMAYRRADRDAEAQTAMRRAYEGRAARHGEDDERTLFSLSNYANLLSEAAGAPTAEPLLRQALAGKRMTLGSLHPSTLSTWATLAANLDAQREQQAAEIEYRAVLAAMDAADVFSGYAMANLASLLEDLGRLDDALHFSDLAYRQLQARHGSNHPDTLVAAQTLASVLAKRRESADAEHWFEVAVQTATDVFGSEHPATLRAKGNHALALAEAGRFGAAEKLCRDVLTARSRVLGDHAETAVAAFNLGDVLERMGRDADAEPLLRKAVEIRLDVLKERHPSTVIACNRLGTNLHRQGKYEPAAKWQHKAVECSKATWGPFHPETLTCLSALGGTYGQLEDYENGAACYRQVLEGRRETLGDSHEKTASAARTYLDYVFASGDPAARLAATLDGLTWLPNGLGEDHAVTRSYLRAAGLLLLNSGRYEAAETWLQRAIEATERAEGSDSPDALDLRDSLGVALQGQGKLERAEAVLQSAHDALVARLGADDPNTIGTASNLGFVLRKRGESARSAPFIRAVLRWRLRELGDADPKTIRCAMDFMTVVEAAPRAGDFELLAPFQGLAQRAAPPLEYAAYLRALGVTRMTREAAPTEADLRHAQAFLAVAWLRFWSLEPPRPSERAAISRALATLHDTWHTLAPEAAHDRAAMRFREQAHQVVPHR